MKAKDIRIKPISGDDANHIIRTLHYSGKVVRNSQLHFGVFLNDRCGGAIQFGPSLDKSKLIGLVDGTRWNEFIELNRLALADWLPRNSESRSLAVCFRLMRKHYPHLKWVVSFADATQCGDGTIYRAAGFVLTGITKNQNLVQLPTGDVVHKMTLESGPHVPRKELGGRSYFDITGGRYDLEAYTQYAGGHRLEGHQLRYVYFLDPAYRQRLTVPELPFDTIDKYNARMYKGKRCGGSDTSDTQSLHD